MNDYFKIWQQTKAADDDELLQYLKGSLKPDAEHALEDELINSSFESDAVDGLRELPVQNIQSAVAGLNAELKKMLPARKKLKRRQAFTMQQWLILTLIMVLVIALSAYGLFYLIQH